MKEWMNTDIDADCFSEETGKTTKNQNNTSKNKQKKGYSLTTVLHLRTPNTVNTFLSNYITSLNSLKALRETIEMFQPGASPMSNQTDGDEIREARPGRGQT